MRQDCRTNLAAIAPTVGAIRRAGPAPAILKAMTTNATRLLGVDAQRGTLQVGMFADLIATPENPLTTIETLKRVTFVMKNGVVVR
ncbi:MAG: amidohydrolase family protein [Gemmatimonadota bacterium]